MVGAGAESRHSRRGAQAWDFGGPGDTRAMPSATADFKGNKQSLPSKPCLQCGRPMTWRRAWAKNWAEVKYCSDRCRADAKRARA